LSISMCAEPPTRVWFRTWQADDMTCWKCFWPPSAWPCCKFRAVSTLGGVGLVPCLVLVEHSTSQTHSQVPILAVPSTVSHSLHGSVVGDVTRFTCCVVLLDATVPANGCAARCTVQHRSAYGWLASAAPLCKRTLTDFAVLIPWACALFSLAAGACTTPKPP
jgi:hypothetical protein